MHRRVLPFVIGLTICSLAVAQSKPSTVVGGPLKVHELKLGDKPRSIRVWLPPGYDARGDRRYPVLYMHDGQNCFDAATAPNGEWRIDESLTALIRERKVEPIIVVGIDNGGNDRIGELTFVPNNGTGGNGKVYEAFIVDVVKPFVDQTYRTQPGREQTLLGGSSLGATASIEIARRHPQLFGKVLAMSPSLWWGREALTREIAADATALRETTIWLDMGEREGPPGPARAALVAMAKRFSQVLTAAGVKHQLTIDIIGEHNEYSWARRFPAAIQFLIPAPPQATD